MARNPTASKPVDLEAAFAEAAAGRRVKVRRGRQAAAVVPLADLAQLEALDAEEDADLSAVAKAARAEAEASGEPAVPWEDVKRRAGLA